MSEIYYAMIIFPIIFNVTLMFIFASSLESIEAKQVQLNCPYPVNSGVATLGVTQDFPDINYTIVYDGDSDDYHVTIFDCAPDSVTGAPSVVTNVYIADTTNSWFDITNRASGYMFYISQAITSFFQKITAFGSLGYVLMFPVAEVSGLAFFAYIQIVLYGFVAFGLFMVIRG